MNEKTTEQKRPFLPYGRQVLGEAECKAVAEVIASGWISRGPKGREFEARVAEYCGARFGVAVSSGTAGLHIAALAAGLGPGQRLWTTPISFVATANCALHAGAEVAFVDIDRHTVNLDIDLLAAKLKAAESEGTLPNLVIPVHFAGHACPMERLAALADTYGFRVIEDACHALGGSYKGAKIGNCRHADMTVLSFHPVKSITTAEGGLVLTNDEATYRRLLCLRNNGMVKDEGLIAEAEGPWYYEVQDLGFNYWMSELQAALGLCQMDRLDDFIARRNELAQVYVDRLRALPVRPVLPDEDCRSAFHLMVVQLELERINRTRGEVFAALQAAGIGVQVHYVPIPAHPYYRARGFRMEDYPEAQRYYAAAITLPLFPTLTTEDVERVVRALREALGAS